MDAEFLPGMDQGARMARVETLLDIMRDRLGLLETETKADLLEIKGTRSVAGTELTT